MNLMGFYIGGHDSNVSFADDAGNVSYFKLERLIQSKHKKGNLQWIKELCDEERFVPDAICFSDGNRNQLGICEYNKLWSEVSGIPGLFNKPTFCIDHHYAHILSSWPVMEQYIGVNYGICVDGRGDHQIKCSVIKDPFNINQARFTYLNDKDEFCLIFNKIGKMMKLQGGELDFAGKIMGAHAYGQIDEKYVLKCNEHILKNGISNLLLFPYKNQSIESLCEKMDVDYFNWLASFHYIIGEKIKDVFLQHVGGEEKTVVYAGGGAQNTVYNEMLSKIYDVIIPPHCYDGGISLGCIKYLSLLYDKAIVFEEFPFGQGGSDVGYADICTIKAAARYLSEGKIVGWCQGKGEIGPRALGHRSILMNPAITNGKDIINMRVKKREKWRPFAASILDKDSKDILGADRKLNYMLHAVRVEPAFMDLFGSVVHVDGTCRFQTVEDTKILHSFYELIGQFKKITGIPALLNTSYNIAGEPIADSAEDILNAFGKLDLDVLCIGNKIIMKEEL